MFIGHHIHILEGVLLEGGVSSSSKEGSSVSSGGREIFHFWHKNFVGLSFVYEHLNMFGDVEKESKLGPWK